MYFIFDCFQDMEIPVLISQSFQMSGLHKEALQAAELVLKQVIIEKYLNSTFLVINDFDNTFPRKKIMTGKNLQDRHNPQALIAKAEVLFSTCNFEHALKLFTRYFKDYKLLIFLLFEMCPEYRIPYFSIKSNCDSIEEQLGNLKRSEVQKYFQGHYGSALEEKD